MPWTIKTPPLTDFRSAPDARRRRLFPAPQSNPSARKETIRALAMTYREHSEASVSCGSTALPWGVPRRALASA
eukprot:2713847-Heterocapsa_arctica.AAC.1